VRRAALVSPLRTAVGSFGGSLRPLTAERLAVQVIQAVLQRSGVDGADIDEVIVAQSYASSEAPCLGRYAALAAGLPLEVPGYTLDRRCGSGLQAVIDAAMMVQTA
jgi:acetyl-CoA C-acetyltransferase